MYVDSICNSFGLRSHPYRPLLVSAQVLNELLATIVRHLGALHKLLDAFALLDLLAGFAAFTASAEGTYVRPQLSETGELSGASIGLPVGRFTRNMHLAHPIARKRQKSTLLSRRPYCDCGGPASCHRSAVRDAIPAQRHFHG